MPHIVWDNSFSVNNEEIDNQHKKWIAIINKLHDSLIHNTSLNEITENSLQAMEEYARFHFTYEEEFMQKINYPDLTKHKKEHEFFLLEIKKCHHDADSGKMILNTSIMKMLMNWLQDHILLEDKKYGDLHY